MGLLFFINASIHLALACRSLPFLSQSVKIIAAFFQESFSHQPLDSIEDRYSSLGIVAARLKQFMQVERLFSPMLEHPQNFLCQRIHRESTLPARPAIIILPSKRHPFECFGSSFFFGS